MANEKKPTDKVPRGFNQIKGGDRWIGFAYTQSERNDQPLSHITGFYECIQPMRYGNIPLPPATLDKIAAGKREGWMIEGEPHGEQPRKPVCVPPIDDLLGHKHCTRPTLVPITEDEFAHICEESLRLQFDTDKIPLLGREPRSEQELLAIVARGHEAFGIHRILRIQTAFPDLLVNIEGGPNEVHLELEVYSRGFCAHKHDTCVNDGKFADGKDVAVLAWIDNDKDLRVKKCVHGRVFELRSLIRKGKKIVWPGHPAAMLKTTA